jgi:hypothetical protein
MAVTTNAQPGFFRLNGAGFGAPGKGPGPGHHIDVLCQDQSPTITDGYAIWQNVPRPLLRGLTVFQGYNPTTMELNIRVGRWVTQTHTSNGATEPSGISWLTDYNVGSVGQAVAGPAVENDIKWLGWMAGEAFTTGQSPAVYIDNVTGASGNPVPQRWLGPKVPWVISGLEWGTAYRNRFGQRVFQEAKVTLMQYISIEQSAPVETPRQNGGYYRTTKLVNTCQKIASAVSAKHDSSYIGKLATQILTASQNKHLKLRATKAVIKNGTNVYVPPHT